MGYKLGQGLGREGTGITTPIMQSSQMGRRGFGYSVEGLERAEVKWEEEEVWQRTPLLFEAFRSVSALSPITGCHTPESGVVTIFQTASTK